MNFNPSHIAKTARTRTGGAVALLGLAALIAGCGSSGSSSITVGNESDTSSVPHVAGEKTASTPVTTTPTTAAKTPTSGPLATKPAVTVPTGAPPTTLVTKEIVKGTGPEAK